MNYNDHSKLKGQHAFLSPSSVSWMNYTNEDLANKMMERYMSSNRVQMGTALHEFAADSIELGQKLPSELNRRSKITIIQMIRLFLKAKGYSKSLISFVTALPDEVYQTLILYINDGIGYRMDVEQILFYSIFCFGTADAITFKNNVLRISDLKTGTTPAHMEQLMAYAALFCLEYGYKPNELNIELRLYQNGTILEFYPTSDDIVPVMDRIITADKILSKIKDGEE